MKLHESHCMWIICKLICKQWPFSRQFLVLNNIAFYYCTYSHLSLHKSHLSLHKLVITALRMIPAVGSAWLLCSMCLYERLFAG